MTSEPNPNKPRWRRRLEALVFHASATITVIVTIWLIHLALDFFLGQNAKFFDVIPVRYVIDLGDLIVFLKFIYHMVKEFHD